MVGARTRDNQIKSLWSQALCHTALQPTVAVLHMRNASKVERNMFREEYKSLKQLGLDKNNTQNNLYRNVLEFKAFGEERFNLVLCFLSEKIEI